MSATRLLCLGALTVLLASCGAPATVRPLPASTPAPSAPTPSSSASPSDAPAPPPSLSATPSPAATTGAERPGQIFWVTDTTPHDDDQPMNELTVSVISARFGSLSVQTDANARCVALGNYPSGRAIQSTGFGSQTPNASGLVTWRFSARPLEVGIATYTLTCSSPNRARTLKVQFPI